MTYRIHVCIQCSFSYIFRELAKQTKLLTLAFKDGDCERAYHEHVESFSSVTLQAFLVVRLAIGSAEFVVLPRYETSRTLQMYVKNRNCIYLYFRRMMNFASFAVGNFLLMIISTISLADVLPSVSKQNLHVSLLRQLTNLF